jgi:hypothetical protein
MKAADMEPYRLVARPGVSITAESAAALKFAVPLFHCQDLHLEETDSCLAKRLKRGMLVHGMLHARARYGVPAKKAANSWRRPAA